MTETYSLSGDFTSGLDVVQLWQEIDADVGIAPSLYTVNNENGGDDVNIVFASALSAGEKTTLDALVSAHTVVISVFYTSLIPIQTRTDDYKNTNYIRLGSTTFPGVKAIGSIHKITSYSYMDNAVTSYSIKLIDKQSGLTIAEGTFTNTEEERQDLGTISNMPTSETTLEIFGKRTGGTGKNKYFHINNVTLCVV